MHNFLLELFEECLNKTYTDVENAASWAWDRSGDALYLWFEKSHGLVDWQSNLDFVAVPYHGMEPQWRCHGGFLRAFQALKPHLLPLIEDPTLRRVCTVGYSHGAALALLSHELIWYRRPDLRERLCGYGFGCPRVLHGCPPPEVALRWRFFWRVTNEGDAVTHLPPRALGFCHVGGEVSIGRAGEHSAVDAHRPESYRAALAEYGERAQNPHVNSGNTY